MLNGKTYQTNHLMDKDARNTMTNWYLAEYTNSEAIKEISYDDLNRVSGSSLYNHLYNSGSTAHYTKLPILNETYTYNDISQTRTSSQVSSVSLTNSSGYSKVLTYEYNNLGYISKELQNTICENTHTYDSEWMDLLVKYNGNSITYDQIGNPKTYYDNSYFSWEQGRQLASINKNRGMIYYKYNEEGLRTSKGFNHPVNMLNLIKMNLLI